MFLLDKDYYYHVWFFTCAHILIKFFFLLLLDTNNWKPFNCVETIAILVRIQISSNSFKNEITDKLFTYKWYTCISI